METLARYLSVAEQAKGELSIEVRHIESNNDSEQGRDGGALRGGVWVDG